MGRKTKCTPEMVEKICESLRLGDFRKGAVESAGIPERTFQRWMAEGEQPEGRARYRRFRRLVLEAEQHGKNLALSVLSDSLTASDKALASKNAQWLLERRHGFRREQHVKLDAAVKHSFNDEDLVSELQDLLPEDAGAGEE